MTSIVLQAVFVVCSLALLSSARWMNEREALIDAAIQEVKREVTHTQSTKLSKAQQMLKAFKMSSPESKAQGMAAYKFERMVNLAERKILKSQRQATAQSSSMAEALAMELFHKPGSILTGEEIAKMYSESECAEVTPPPPDCDSTDVRIYRTADGTCNNLENPTYGAAGTPMSRLIPARYDDGTSVPRGFLQSQGSPLSRGGPFYPPIPSARVCSADIVEDRPVNDTLHTHILMQWGQFMDHDLDIVPEFEECPEGCEVSAEDVGRCYPIPVPADDFLLTQTDSDSISCLGFRRSLPVCPPEDSEHLVRQHLNAITHFIDGSMVYHHDPEVQANLIRDPDSDSGMLSVGDPDPGDPDRFLLPLTTPDFTLCPPFVPDGICFLAGDVRVNEQAGLTVMHTIWVREHNRIAGIISTNNPFFTSDQVFQATRNIVASMIQKITYKDFLPILLGSALNDLIPPYAGYDSEVDPSIPNAFAAAAFRYGHSQIQPFFERLGPDHESIPEGPLSLNDAFFDTSAIMQHGVDPLLRGLLKKPAREVDEFVNSILTNNLFAPDDSTPGLDLVSLNLQRGRDHGLPPYMVWKQWAKEKCGLESDFRNEITEIHFYQVYGSLDNVDLFVGGLAEQPLEGGVVGAVFGCIFAKTFLNLRDGDRFYYENPEGSLTPAQIAEIEEASLSRVICDNSDISEIQSNAFFANPKVNCDTLQSVDLSEWTEEPPLTGDCYTRVCTDASVSVSIVSANSRFESFLIPADSHYCYSTICPANVGATNNILVFAQPGFSHEQNSGLPDSDADDDYIYQNTLDSDLFVPTNGFYGSQQECDAGPYCAVTFSGPAEKQNTGAMYIDPERIADVISDKQVLAEFLRHRDSQSSTRQMEEMLQAMDAEASKKEVKKEDAQLVSNLERLLEKIK